MLINKMLHSLSCLLVIGHLVGAEEQCQHFSEMPSCVPDFLTTTKVGFLTYLSNKPMGSGGLAQVWILALTRTWLSNI